MNQDHCLVEQFEMIFRAHFSSVKFFINMFLKSEADAEDLAQDVFTKLWTNFETWQNNDGKEGYIYAMAKNVAFDFIKHKRLENDYREEQIKKSTIKDLLGFSDPLNSLYYKEMQLIIRMALENFPESSFSALQSRYPKDIDTINNITATDCHNRINSFLSDFC